MDPLAEFRRLANLLIMRERPDRDVAWIVWQLRALFREIPGLALSVHDLQETFSLDHDTCQIVVEALTEAGFLRQQGDVVLLAA